MSTPDGTNHNHDNEDTKKTSMDSDAYINEINHKTSENSSVTSEHSDNVGSDEPGMINRTNLHSKLRGSSNSRKQRYPQRRYSSSVTMDPVTSTQPSTSYISVETSSNMSGEMTEDEGRDEVDLMKICVQHNEILHDNFQQLSPLSQLMRRCCPSVLTQSMVALHDKGTISLDLAIQLLQGTSSSGEMYKNTHVKEYLELLLNDTQRRYIFEEAVVLLSEIYIKRLADQKSVISKKRTAPQVLQLPADEGHFGRRYNWLDYLPPFKGPEDMKKPCQYILRASPTTARKNASKIKQHVSLLCFPKASESLLNRVLELLDQDNLVPGQDSILILVLLKTNKQRATDIVVQKYPRVILEFGKCVMSSDREQVRFLEKIVLDSVYSALQHQIGKPDDNEPVYLQSLKDILDFLAKTTAPEEFLNLLPDNGNFLFSTIHIHEL
ncbi:HPS3 [Mytilus edulis]|uniref:HPS3 n=1 Tax=Mytilus edulis TaxID=6550 RepID=A0A8S3VNK7_MYTED|nr:HPS3 [Mytilus edulis]